MDICSAKVSLELWISLWPSIDSNIHHAVIAIAVVAICIYVYIHINISNTCNTIYYVLQIWVDRLAWTCLEYVFLHSDNSDVTRTIFDIIQTISHEYTYVHYRYIHVCSRWYTYAMMNIKMPCWERAPSSNFSVGCRRIVLVLQQQSFVYNQSYGNNESILFDDNQHNHAIRALIPVHRSSIYVLWRGVRSTPLKPSQMPVNH